MALALFSTILAVVSGCDDSLEFANEPPGELSITKNRCFLGPGDTVTLIGRATDADGDEISYSWTAEAGTLSPADGKGQVVTWEAPGGHGTFRVTLEATDELEVASKGIDLDVGRKLDVSLDYNTLDKTDYPYIAQDILPLDISEQTTVEIEAGVTVVFNEKMGGFDVWGTLVINGTQQDRVFLRPNVCPGERGEWKGIRFSGNQAAGTLSCLTIGSTTGGLAVENEAIVTADNIIVDKTYGYGVTVISGGSLTLSNARIWDNGNGIYVEDGILMLQESSIRDNGKYGILMVAGTGPFDVTVLDCVVAKNSQYGFGLEGVAKPVVNNCSIFMNGPYEVDGHTLILLPGYINTGPIDMTGNFWDAATAVEIEKQITKNGSPTEVDYSGWLDEPPVYD